MATAPRPFFTRPCEYYLASGTDFSIDSSPVTDFDQGVHPNVMSLAFALADYLAVNDHSSWDYRMNDSGTFSFYQASGSSVNLDWESSGIGLLLGFTGTDDDFATSAWTEADTLPWGVWIPSFEVADQGSWKPIGREVASGAVSQNGTWAGTSKGTTVYHRRMRFNMEASTNTLVSRATDSSHMTAQEFFNGSLTAQRSVDSYPSCQGFWCYPNMNDAISDCGLTTTHPWMEATDIGVEFALSSSPDTKCFCHTEPSLLPDWDAAATLPVSTIYYTWEIGMHTAPVESGWAYRDHT